MVLPRLLRSHRPLGVLLAAMSALECLAHAVKLSDAVVVVPAVVVVAQTVLVLGRFHHDQDVEVDQGIALLLLFFELHLGIFLLLHFN